jgi:hypothetical protein
LPCFYAKIPAQILVRGSFVFLFILGADLFVAVAATEDAVFLVHQAADLVQLLLGDGNALGIAAAIPASRRGPGCLSALRHTTESSPFLELNKPFSALSAHLNLRFMQH